MKKLLLVLVLGLMASCTTNTTASSQTTKQSKKTPVVAKAELFNTADKSSSIGEAIFTQLKDGKIRMDLKIHYPENANKSVAVHVHEHGDCGNKGDNTHGHWNPTNSKHGKWGVNPFHSGDIGNISLDAEGNGAVSITTDLWGVVDGATNTITGRGIIVHGGVDDYTSQPAGNSGPRVGCGVINKF